MSETKRSKTGQRNTATSRSGAKKSVSSKKASADRVAAVKSARNSGTGSQQTRRTAGTYRRRKRRQSPDFAKLLLILIGIVIAILCISVGIKGCAKDGEESKSSEKATEAPETEIHAEITVNGISINGLTKSQAMDEILADMGWDMNVSYNGEIKPLENLMSTKVDQVLEEAFSNGKAGSYQVDSDGLEDQVYTAIESVVSGWDVQPKNGSIHAFDKASGTFSFTAAEVGKVINRDALAAEILAAIEAEEYAGTFEATARDVQPEITEAQARESFKRIGTYTTTTTSNKARNENIRIASEALNGMIIQPGQEFSFNLTTGNRTPEKGYKAAGAYVNGVLVEEPGGGVCQVSSTLYNAVVFSGLKTTERHAHSYEPSYVTPGEDAMVSYDGYSGPDMKFINNSKTAVGIKTSFSNQKLTVSVYGSPILEEGVTLSMVSKKTKELAPPEPVYEEDQTLEPGIEVEAKAATPGSRWVTNLVTKKDGVVVEEILLHNSTYKGKPATIKRNTSGVVIPAEGESGAEVAGSEPQIGVEPTTEPADQSESGSEVTTAPTESQTNPGPQAPGGSSQTGSETTNPGPGEQDTPSMETSGSASGPAGALTPSSGPQTPSDIPSSGPSAGPSQSSTPGSSGVPGGVTAEPSAGPGNPGLITPIG